MEPPAKRMRILQSVEVDEENVEYIKAKQKQQQRLKSRFESIFEKFGNMNESQSDEIDMKTNRVVVDRGHLRRLKRHINGKEKTLLDTIVLATGRNSDEDAEEEAGEEDSEDELAPPQLAKSKTTVPPEQDMSKRQVEPTVIDAQQSTSPRSDIATTLLPQFGVPQTPNTPNPIAHVLPYLQFPQTPAGQEAQGAFYANLAQALAPLLTGQKPPNAPMNSINAAPAPITPIATNDKVAPATDPKWFFPPLSANPRQCPIAQSSPLPNHTEASIAKEAESEQTDTIEVAEERPTMTLYTRPDITLPRKPRRSSPRVEIQRRVPQSARKYHFNREDDVYISKCKRKGRIPWAAIKAGREKWKEWPMSALHDRWILIKNQNLHLQDVSVTPDSGHVSGSDHLSTEEVHAISKPPHHLPTPSSSEHEECHQSLVEATGDSIHNMLSSSAHYDDDDRDLLSLAGSDSDEYHLPTGDDDATEVASQDLILPSIETRDLVDDGDTMLADLPSTPQTQDFIMTPTRASSPTIKTEPASSPTALVKRNRCPLIASMIPDSQETEDDMQDDSSNIIVTPRKPSEPTRTPVRHQLDRQSAHTTPVRRRSASLDLIGDDELLFSPPGPTTPPLKHKQETNALPSTLLSSSHHQPKPREVEVSSEMGSIKSTLKANRKSFLKRVKREWTRKGTPVKDSAVGKRRSLGGALGNLNVKKRKWVDDDLDESEDELARF